MQANKIKFKHLYKDKTTRFLQLQNLITLWMELFNNNRTSKITLNQGQKTESRILCRLNRPTPENNPNHLRNQ